MIATADHVMRMLDPYGALVLLLLVCAAIAFVAWARSVHWGR